MDTIAIIFVVNLFGYLYSKQVWEMRSRISFSSFTESIPTFVVPGGTVFAAIFIALPWFEKKLEFYNHFFPSYPKFENGVLNLLTIEDMLFCLFGCFTAIAAGFLHEKIKRLAFRLLRKGKDWRAAYEFDLLLKIKDKFDDFDRFLLDSVGGGSPFLITTTSNKVYYGYVYSNVDLLATDRPSNTPKHLRINPILSGYRGENHRIILTDVHPIRNKLKNSTKKQEKAESFVEICQNSILLYQKVDEEIFLLETEIDESRITRKIGEDGSINIEKEIEKISDSKNRSVTSFLKTLFKIFK